MSVYRVRMRLAVVCMTACACLTSAAQDVLPQFVPGETYDSSILHPESVLGFSLGSRAARYAEVVTYLKYLAEKSPRVRLVETGETYEGRKQYHLIISAEGNLEKIDRIRADIGRLAGWGELSNSTAENLAQSTPAIVWAGYGIHGDELSSVDAALFVMYHLAAATSAQTQSLLRELVVCIDPMQNPDGRERFLAQMQQWAGPALNTDAQSVQHSGLWPYGRGNHYLFDLNRDWFLLTQVESRNRVSAVVNWNPQVIIDSHEMGAYDTYLFAPPREPINPNVPANASKWWKVFSSDQAKAFDRYGWSYYTREWSDEWYPGYGSSYALYIGAIGILYEQAGVDGTVIKRPDGRILTYREAVHHHIVSTLANLTTAAGNRVALLKDYTALRRSRVGGSTDAPEVFYLLPGKNPSRLRRLVETLVRQKIEVRVAGKQFRASDLRDSWGGRISSKTLPAGTCIVSLDQPMERLAKAILEFDPRMKTSVLQEERKSLEKEKDSKQYDVTGWSLPMAYGIEAYWSDEVFTGESAVVQAFQAPRATVVNLQATYGYLIEFTDDQAVEALSRLLDGGYTVRCAKEPFDIEGRSYDRGTLLLRRNENDPAIASGLEKVAQETGASVTGVNTALSSKGPDLGGNDMVLLKPPRIALIAGPEVSTTSFGALWHIFDQRFAKRVSILQLSQVGFLDLRKYNVVVLPSGEGQGYARAFGKAGIAQLKEWIEAGGTIIGIGGGAAFLADTATGLSAVRLRQQALKELELYAKAVALEESAGAPAVDSLTIWGGKGALRDSVRPPKPSPDEKELGQLDERLRLFMPRGCILRVDLDQEHWLAYGVGVRVAAMVNSTSAFLSRDPVRTPGRFSDAEHIRLSGLLWPEARERVAKTAYVTREGRGKGQVLLFAGEPNFRGSFEGTARLLLNAVFLGPGFGTRTMVEW